jgi:hypothetical protein
MVPPLNDAVLMRGLWHKEVALDSFISIIGGELR